MSVYDVDKLMLEARKLAADYRKATGKPLGISNEIAVHDVIRLMHLSGVEAGVGGYDAIGTGEREGRRIQIKGRTLIPDSRSSQRIGQIKMEQAWDSVMLILMNEQYEPLEIYEAERDVIEKTVHNTSSKRKNRGAMSIGKFKSIAQMVWSQDNK
jgi:hypothetical protein